MKNGKSGDKNERVVVCDVDDTLVIWDDKCDEPGEGRVLVVDPYTGYNNYFKPHTEHIRILKHFASRGFYVIVWSQGGGEWAEAVVDALNLREDVDFVLAKPEKYIDDLPCQEWMGSHIYKEPEGK